MGFGGSHSSGSSGPSPLQKERVGLQNKLGQEQSGRAQQIFGEVNPTLQGMLNNPVTPGERSAIFESSMAPVASAFDAAGENAAQRAARTRNPAGLLETDEQLAREKGQGLSTAANRAELSALNIQDQRRSEALRGLAQMYGISEEAMARLLGGMPSPQGKNSSWGFKVVLPSPSGSASG